MKYNILLNIIDKIRLECPKELEARYQPSNEEPEKLIQARSRTFIHLYLKVLFGIDDFKEREHCITDGSYDGGIDGYYIDTEAKTIYLIQSKFRQGPVNFENKKIELEEILAMDVSRILSGEPTDEQGNQYNGKIKQLQREISQVDDIARYRYHVTILANLRETSSAKLRTLTGGYPAEVFDYEKTYEKLVFPVISGTLFTAKDINIPIDLSNKNSGSKISYTVTTKISECEITVLFVPTVEIAKIMRKYKNSILKYNPRSYLDLEGQSVNASIRETILNTSTNEFALYNNGITILSDETHLNERIGQKNKAQLTIKNPQIINGGQTSFTLSRLLDEGQPEQVFENKEVLLKIITLLDKSGHTEKLQLIGEISNATNKQTPVINADKYANELLHQKIQKLVFDQYGLLYERKRGEFSDGITNGYINPELVIERNEFLRIFYSANGNLAKGYRKKLFQKNDLADIDLTNTQSFERFHLGFNVFKLLAHGQNMHQRTDKGLYAKVFAYTIIFSGEQLNNEHTLKKNIQELETQWKSFLNIERDKSKHGRKAYIDTKTGEPKIRFNERTFYESGSFAKKVADHFKNSISPRSSVGATGTEAASVSRPA
jgi:hypothetical protein